MPWTQPKKRKIDIFYFIIVYICTDVIAETFKYHFTATNGHSECLRLLIGNAEPQNAVDIQDGNGQ